MNTLVKLAGIDERDADSKRNASGWGGSVQTKGQFSLASWWKFGWDITAESDDGFRRFYKLDNILQTDRVNSVYLRGQSERNYFAITAYQLGGLLYTDTSTVRKPRAAGHRLELHLWPSRCSAANSASTSTP